MFETANSLSKGEALASLRDELRGYEQELDRAQRKRLGQFFSGARASSLLAALSVGGEERSIVDPMAGHGDLLDAVAVRSALKGNAVRLTAVEIDPPTARLAERRLKLCAQLGGHSSEVIQANAFDATLWSGDRAPGTFDLVITNPPYVRYQERGRDGVDSFDGDDVRSALREIVRTMPERTESEVWSTLVDGYSGLADLSVPSWLLCGLLVKPGGILALVVPQTWMTREYAKVVQYVQYRFFEPLVIVQEHGVGWFEDALVPATLVVSRRLRPDKAMVPMACRAPSNRTTAVATIRSTAADDRSLVGRIFAVSDPDSAFAARLSGDAARLTEDVTVEAIDWAVQQRIVLSRCRDERWFRSVGEIGFHSSCPCEHEHASVPAPLLAALGVAADLPLTSIERLGFRIGQGLRTGCNSFFYVEAVAPALNGERRVRTSEVLGGQIIPVPDEILRPVIRRQSDVSGVLVAPFDTSGRVLDLRGWRLPEVSAPALKQMPEPLAMLVRLAARTAVGPPERRVLIPELSAVRTNSRSGSGAEPLLPGVGTPRCWYMLPDFASRHLPEIFVARVNSATPWFVLNSREPLLIDANFATIYDGSGLTPPSALFALLNSTWCRACTEFLGTPLGGGALKLEATQLRHLPLPDLHQKDLLRLAALGEKLATLTRASSEPLMVAIDHIVLSALAPESRSADVLDRLHAIVADRRSQRSRARQERSWSDRAD